MTMSVATALAREQHYMEMQRRKSRRRSRITSVLLPPVKPPLNGKREVARRLRQIAAGQLKVG